jgi:hypothetical protein
MKTVINSETLNQKSLSRDQNPQKGAVIVPPQESAWFAYSVELALRTTNNL